MRMTNDEYKRLYEGLAPPSPSYKNIPFAFLIGGGICALAQWIKNLWLGGGFAESDAASLTSSTMVFIGVALTALGLFGKIARVAGAGTLVPITGFANSVCAPAMEFRREGLVMGLGAKLFTVAGPVLTYGITTSILVGVVYYLVQYVF